MNLPEAFEDLESWCETWVLEDGRARAATRQTSSYEDLKAFYDVMLEAAPRILEHIGERPLGELAPVEAKLLKLLLGFAEVIPAVEFYQQPQVIDGFPAEKFRLVDALSDLAVQE